MPLVRLAPFKVARRSAAARTARLSNVPAPVGGLNLRDPIIGMPATDAMVLDNMIPRLQGVELRKGWQYITSAVGAGAAPVKSVFGYTAPNPADNKIFCAAGGNIYDITTGTPSTAVSATGSTTNIWSTVMFSTGADTFLLAVSPGAGYYTYSAATGWVLRTLTGTAPPSPNGVAVFKQRVMFTSVNDPNVYYLNNVNAITGNSSAFNMGAQLRHGGGAQALVNWTLDAGAGIDDHLAVIGSQGDVLIWSGTDPGNANSFFLKGVWYVGPVPQYGRFYSSIGGDVLILSELGITPLSRLVNGQFSEGSVGPSDKVQNVLGPLVTSLRTTEQWGVQSVPSEEILLIKLPKQTDEGFVQYAMNISTGAWCTFSDMPMNAINTINGILYFGLENGQVARAFFNTKDGIAVNGTGGDIIEGDVQTAFTDFGSPGNLKKFGMARPIFTAPAQPQVKLRVNTQFSTASVEGSPSFIPQNTALWNTATWNAAVWVGTSNTYQAFVGSAAMGYYGSVRMKVRGAPGTIFLSTHMLTENGGMM
jgi:hypothetical protein